jgi:hypothetical protein
VGGMGTAGVATGALTGAIEPLPPATPPLSLPGNVLILDPSNNDVPETDFTTDANGEVIIKVVPQQGATEVAVKIGDETFVVDLTEAPSTTNALEVALDYYDFTDISTGYQSTATLTPDFGEPLTDPVYWTLVSVTNPSGSFWRRLTGDTNGLTWGQTADGTTDWDATPVVGTPPNDPTIYLTDIVGSRTVVVNAATSINGTPKNKELTINFGPGPMSVFAGLTPTSVQWATVLYISNWTTTGPPSFPAAASCSGNTWAPGTSISESGGEAFYSENAGWRDRIYNSLKYGYTSATKLPTMDQLLAVARYDGSGVPRKGAALAAGYSISLTWTGEITYHDVPTTFSTIVVDLDNGAIYEYETVLSYRYTMCIN